MNNEGNITHFLTIIRSTKGVSIQTEQEVGGNGVFNENVNIPKQVYQKMEG